jgi:hypothetical protein
LAIKHLAIRHLVIRHLTIKHLAIRHLAIRHLAIGHLTNSHLTQTHSVNILLDQHKFGKVNGTLGFKKYKELFEYQHLLILETLSGQNSNLYLNFVHFFNTRVNYTTAAA